jgi:hypothetical protein
MAVALARVPRSFASCASDIAQISVALILCGKFFEQVSPALQAARLALPLEAAIPSVHQQPAWLTRFYAHPSICAVSAR